MKSTSISYSGQLTLKTKTRTEIRKNNGTLELFRVLTHALCGNLREIHLSLPGYVMLYHGESANNSILTSLIENTDYNSASHSNNRILYSPIDITRNVKLLSDGTYEAQFSGIINFGNLKLRSDTEYAEESTMFALALVSQDRKKILAVVDFDRFVFEVLRDGGQTTFNWCLTFENPEND